ncbi:type IV pilus modification protein PilV [Sapientia aquatica]|uniref:Type IV pilus modification protein PilV n=1 Tax=Sapientia aquatica TaxID=1549640 RepID=A0A4R5W4K2_9BURK|nr:type IV pilus modification protein PilV [Sapientia aquatica]TDK68021.1 type IV pilus modification protein PilV [Sapientia aquatica]
MLINTALKQKQLGVSLLEVLIALLIIALGVLGIAKMQALSISNTQVSGSRGLIALQASSIASVLHDNRGYWQTTTPPCNGPKACTFTGTSTSYFGNVPASCTIASPCTKTAVAAYEFDTRLKNLYQIAPSYGLNINCTAAGGPTSCTIAISWVEKQAAGNASTASIVANQSATTQYYYLYVQP